MADKESHLRQYRKNKNLANSDLLASKIYRDWKVTVIFYATMHLMDSTYSDIYPKHNTHEKRKNFIGRTLPYKNVIDEYTELENLSRRSRYDCIPIEMEEVKQAEELMECIEEFAKGLNSPAS
ncbi:hypothetical protein [Clostridium perfringens]|uniref:hypothetical protein n=1 Tax=Clostridium perfringens TaxID=1502 RepID=UPI0018E459E6|nr:hypothetical protein [Clostridium perfringens]MBI6040211.1 hypothetical protein [Clostridium perfringens]MBO3374914.1 hypothetical protein [Clostridium perfringens]